MKIEDLLKSQGYTDADIAAMGPLLSDQRFRSSIEGTISTLSQERDDYKSRDEEWAMLRDTKYVPALSAAAADAMKHRREAADLREQIKIAKEYGYMGDDAEAKAREVIEANRQREAATPGAGFNIEDPKFKEFANNYSRGQGDAIALHEFLQEEYRILHGDSINNYRATIGGRELRGMVALRAESQAAGKRIDDYIETKFNWAGKRQEAEQKRQADHDARVAREAVEKYAVDHGANPLAARPQISREPLIPRTKPGDKPVWQIPASERRNARLERAYASEAKERLN